MVELHTDYKKEFSEDEDVFNMPFKEAIKEMKRRKSTISDKIKDIEQKEKQNYFWIKKTVDLEVTKRIYSELLKNLQEGKNLHEFLKKVSEFNLPKSYLKGVYRTVTTQAQQRGHLDQQLKAVDLGFEYGIFYAILDGRQTKICNSLNNKVMKLKDFVDKGYYPPLHYMCRSHILQVDEQKLKKMNITPLENVKPNENPFSDFTSDWDKKYKELYKKKEKEAKVIRKSIDKLQDKGYNNTKKSVEYAVVDNDFEKKLQQQSNTVYYQLNAYEREALSEYTQGGYIYINGNLADNIKNKYVDNLNNSIEKFKLTKDIITYRGTNEKYYKNLKIGDIFKGKVFYSTTINYEQAMEFAYDHTKYDEEGYKGILLEIQVPKNTKCLYIGSNTDYNDGNFIINERELLLSNKLKYKVKDINNGKIVLEVINGD